MSALKEVADAKRVAQIVLQAHEMELDNVKACFGLELEEIVLAAPIFEILKNTTEGTEAIAAVLRSRISPALGR